MNSLSSFSDRELINRLRTLVKKEQNLTLEIIPHLVEVIHRGLHLGNGYGSLYEYCKGELDYTDASAWRRARAAQAVVRCPEAMDPLREGRVNLCTLGRVHKFITPVVLKEICGKSKAEVELIAAVYDAKGVSPDRTRPVMVPKVTARKPSTRPKNDEVPPAAGVVTNRLRGEVTTPTQNHSRPLRSEVSSSERESTPALRGEVANARLEFEQKWKIEGVVSKEVKKKLDRCKSLLSRKYPHGVDYEILLGELAEMFLERVDPQRKQKRRKKREVKQRGSAKLPPKMTESRHIPAREKEKVWIRDKGRCTFVGANGKRCNSTHNIQFDHYPIPFARRGPNNAGNLRLLCAKHNRYTAEKTFGNRDYSGDR
jgi:hypothetical protein